MILQTRSCWRRWWRRRRRRRDLSFSPPAHVSSPVRAARGPSGSRGRWLLLRFPGSRFTLFSPRATGGKQFVRQSSKPAWRSGPSESVSKEKKTSETSPPHHLRPQIFSFIYCVTHNPPPSVLIKLPFMCFFIFFSLLLLLLVQSSFKNRATSR